MIIKINLKFSNKKMNLKEDKKNKENLLLINQEMLDFNNHIHQHLLNIQEMKNMISIKR